MISMISICNDALDKLGQSPIVSIADRDTNSRLCARNYFITRDHMLREHPWNFAISRRTLPASTSGEKSWGFTHTFPIPHGCLRLLEIRDLGPEDYQLEKNEILANADSLDIRYVRRISDPSKYDVSFANALGYLLAIKLSYAISIEPAQKKLLNNEALRALIVARTIDAQENPVVLPEEDDWIKVRL